MNFDLSPFDSQCFVSDVEWEMILQSGTHIKTGNVYHVVFKRNVITFKITDVGNIELLRRRKVPNSNYKLPLFDRSLSFQKRSAIYSERMRLQKGGQLDDENYLKYGT